LPRTVLQLFYGKFADPNRESRDACGHNKLFKTGAKPVDFNCPSGISGGSPAGAGRLGLQRLAAATGMVALARKLGQVLCVLAGLAAILLVVRGNTTTGGVGALLGFGHSVSPRVACSAILFAFYSPFLPAG
jgi:hypothetical protein